MLLKRNNTPTLEDLFGDDRNKVLARYIIRHDLKKNIDDIGIADNSNKYVHVIAIGYDKLILEIIRYIALIAHYPNFNDELKNNRTKITIIVDNISDTSDLEIINNKIVEATGNLLHYCHNTSCIINDDSIYILNENNIVSFLDIEFEIIGLDKTSISKYFESFFEFDDRAIVTVVANKNHVDLKTANYINDNFYQYYEIDINRLNQIVADNKIDTRCARLVNMVYNLGTYLNEINSTDINNVKAYNLVISTFLNHTSRYRVNKEWKKIEDNNTHNPSYAKELKLSNVFCSDCFESRIRSVLCKTSYNEAKSTKLLIEENMIALARSEHARWNVEKLILGFRPYTREESYKDELLYASNYQEERKLMKTKHKAHIDICSCNRLKQIDPMSYKYDCFLVLAIHSIINKK